MGVIHIVCLQYDDADRQTVQYDDTEGAGEDGE